MPVASVVGLDHLVVTVADLDRAAEGWRRLGFTLSPRGLHSAHLGTANHTIMLDPDYLELLGVAAETEHNAATRDFLARRGEGVERAAFTTTDADAGVADLKARGLAASGPLDFGRPVSLPDGQMSEARFRTFFWPTDRRPGDLRLFACQHLTRGTVWIPDLMRHANTARRIAALEVLARDPVAAAAEMAALTAAVATPEPDGAVAVPSGPGRAPFVFLDRMMLAARHPDVPLDGLPEEGAAGLVLVADDLGAAADASGAVPSGDGVAVPPAAANGLVLAFVRAG